MFLPIKASTSIIIGLSIIMLLPQIHLLLIFLFMSTCEWFDKLFKKIYNLLTCLYEIIEHLLENSIIYLIVIYFLSMSIRRFAAI
jgi:hypothetical protein